MAAAQARRDARSSRERASPRFGVGSVAVLPLFGTPSAEQDPAKCKATDLSAKSKKLIVSNWPAYIDVDPEKGQTTTLQDFEKRTGIKVDYTDDVNDNAEFFAKVRNQLGDCEPIGRDMMMLTDWMAAKMIGLGWVQPLDAAEGAQPPQEPDQATPGPPVGQGPDLLGSLAERPDRHRLQRQEDQGGRQLRRAAHPLRPQGQDHAALGDARHDGVHDQDRRAATPTTSPTTSGPTPSTSCAVSSRPGRCAPSPATSTSRT